MNSIKIKCQAFEIELHSDIQTPQELAEVYTKVVQTTPPVLTVFREAPQLPFANDGTAEHIQPPKAEVLSPPPLSVQDNSEPKPVKPKSANGKGEEAVAHRKIVEMLDKGMLEDVKSQPEIREMLSTAGYNISPKRLANLLLRLVREECLVREGKRREYRYRRATTVPTLDIIQPLVRNS
jgi:hypothetical protein